MGAIRPTGGTCADLKACCDKMPTGQMKDACVQGETNAAGDDASCGQYYSGFKSLCPPRRRVGWNVFFPSRPPYEKWFELAILCKQRMMPWTRLPCGSRLAQSVHARMRAYLMVGADTHPTSMAEQRFIRQLGFGLLV